MSSKSTSQFKTKNSETTKNIWFLSVSLFIVIALLAATIVLTSSQTTIPMQEIDPVFLDSHTIVYSPETIRKFKESYRLYLKSWLNPDIHAYFDTYVNIDALGAQSILTALQKAKISADKTLAFATYLKSSTDHSNLGSDDLYGLYSPQLDENGNVVVDENGEVVLETLTSIEIFTSLINSISFSYHLNELISHTGITTLEFGRFLYEFIILSYPENDERIELLVSFGNENFSQFFSDINTLLGIFNEFSKGYNITYADARVVRELLYSQGSRLDKLLDDFGGEYIENLLGIGGEIVSADSFKDGKLGLTSLDIVCVNGISIELSDTFDFFLSTASEFMKNFGIEPLNSLVDYYLDKSSADFSYAALSIIRNFSSQLDTKGVFDNEIIPKLASILAYTDIIGSDTVFDQDAFSNAKAEETLSLLTMYSTMIELNQTYLNIKSVSDIKALDAYQQEQLSLKISDFLVLYNRQTANFTKVFNIICFGFFLKIVG
ncbi:MAG: hypothetical protein LBU04_00635 [Christensenellaceae bacterium]|jgi:hypothetical protein|nr:hypothetical protein [Christensenellaceae bacterium]